MLAFQERELRQQLFGTSGIPEAKSMSEAEGYLSAVEKVTVGLQKEAQAVDRICARSRAMIDWLEPGPGKPERRPATSGAFNPARQYIAKCALNWWTRIGHDDTRSNAFVAFADQLYRLAGHALKADAIRVQLDNAVARRDAELPPYEPYRAKQRAKLRTKIFRNLAAVALGVSAALLHHLRAASTSVSASVQSMKQGNRHDITSFRNFGSWQVPATMKLGQLHVIGSVAGARLRVRTTLGLQPMAVVTPVPLLRPVRR